MLCFSLHFSNYYYFFELFLVVTTKLKPNLKFLLDVFYNVNGKTKQKDVGRRKEQEKNKELQFCK